MDFHVMFAEISNESLRPVASLMSTEVEPRRPKEDGNGGRCDCHHPSPFERQSLRPVASTGRHKIRSLVQGWPQKSSTENPAGTAGFLQLPGARMLVQGPAHSELAPVSSNCRGSGELDLPSSSRYKSPRN